MKYFSARIQPKEKFLDWLDSEVYRKHNITLELFYCSDDNPIWVLNGEQFRCLSDRTGEWWGICKDIADQFVEGFNTQQTRFPEITPQSFDQYFSLVLGDNVNFYSNKLTAPNQ